MTIEEILNSSMVVTYNVALAKEIGLAEAIILNTIKQAGMTENGLKELESAGYLIRTKKKAARDVSVQCTN